MMRRASIALVALVIGLGCEERSGWQWDLPAGFPTPRVPEDNPMSAEKVELGRFLFYDVRLSGNETQSCASCHRQDLAFTDGVAVSTGSTGDLTPRGSMSLVNVAYVPTLTWANPALVSLEDQALVPMFGEHPVELGLSGREDELLARLRDATLPTGATYGELFAAAFPGEGDPITVANVVRALASFERSIVSARAPYDRWAHQGDESAMSESALRGMDLFFSERLECFHCHGGFNFTDSVAHDGQPLPENGFHNTGLYNVDGRGGYPETNRGLYDHTRDARDMGRFRAPSLRNVELTAPYMHDGSIATLDEVLDHYAAGGRTVDGGPNAGVGAESPLKSIFLHGFELTTQEREDVLAFLRSLTDREVLTDPRFADPF
ncbi:Methylamine utilization protein mauG [Sandaracinus amylolyticus]|uniref:Methylamine utilization protein mauG n=2 Tax=Sandaracinus amylolyticus TaxID=927083 RepID=A0A0F6W014_9BACT|nr:Methylamine utilization protein mauG [Sandaracinus amylolyticus]